METGKNEVQTWELACSTVTELLEASLPRLTCKEPGFVESIREGLKPSEEHCLLEISESNIDTHIEQSKIRVQVRHFVSQAAGQGHYFFALSVLGPVRSQY